MTDRDVRPVGRELQPRHVAMISIGGIIGSGLFLGSSAAIAATGPAVLLSYLLAGAVVLVVMRILAEMAKDHATAGSFTELIRHGLGEVAGFVSGWLYWYFWVLAIALEAMAGAIMLQPWLGLPIWQSGSVLLGAFTALNLISTRAFGEAEFWLSGLKVAALIAFLAIGIAFLAGWIGVASPGLSNFTGHGGFVPFGIGAVAASVTTVVFALVGAEIVAVAAAESADPGRTIDRLMTSLVVRISLFYLASMVVILAIVPWTEIRPGTSPFGMALERVGIPAVPQVMNGLVLVAAMSCLNAGFYVSSRVLAVLAEKGDAPAALVHRNARGVPVRAVLLSAGLAWAGLLASIYFPDGIFTFLVNASGTVMLLLYGLLVAGYLRGRPPSGWLTRSGYAALAAIVAILASIAFQPGAASQFVAGAILVAGTWGAGLLHARRIRGPAAAR
jgi:GABA permease